VLAGYPLIAAVGAVGWHAFAAIMAGCSLVLLALNVLLLVNEAGPQQQQQQQQVGDSAVSSETKKTR
jgi:predicted MFS family arabinose efflux permease